VEGFSCTTPGGVTVQAAVAAVEHMPTEHVIMTGEAAARVADEFYAVSVCNAGWTGQASDCKSVEA
jgi:hypothetical protein